MTESPLVKSPSKLPVHSALSNYIQRLDRFPKLYREGKVMQVIGHMVEATNPGCSVGGISQYL